MTMLQLGAIKKIHRVFFFPSSHPSKDGETKGLWQEIYSRSENDDSDFPSEDLEEPKYLHDPGKLFTQRGTNLIENPRVYILYRSVWKRMSCTSRLMQQ